MAHPLVQRLRSHRRTERRKASVSGPHEPKTGRASPNPKSSLIVASRSSMPHSSIVILQVRMTSSWSSKTRLPDPLRYNERWTSGPTVEGPWGELSAPINETWSEGPSVLQVGDHSVVYYDHYRPPHPRFEAVETKDWIHWTSANDKIHLPEACKHGSFFQITEAEAQRLLARHDR